MFYGGISFGGGCFSTFHSLGWIYKLVQKLFALIFTVCIMWDDLKSRQQNGIRHIHEIYWGKCLCGAMGRGWRRLGEAVLTPVKKSQRIGAGCGGRRRVVWGEIGWNFIVFLIFKKFYLFIWLHWVLVVACRIYLVPWPGIKLRPPALGAQSLSPCGREGSPWNLIAEGLELGASHADWQKSNSIPTAF